MNNKNQKLISISLAPNNEKDDVRLALKMLFRFWEYKNGMAINGFEEEFKKYLKVKSATSFNSGRSALFAILKSLDLKEDDDILVQSFTCNAVINPILWLNLNPVYVDCDLKTFNVSFEDLQKKIDQRKLEGRSPKVLIAQHTFGLPCDMEKIIKICQKENLILVEDCAHALGAKYKSKKVGLPAVAQRAKVGTFGKAAFFSFSRDKVISCVYGGMAVTNDLELARKIKLLQEEIGFPSYFWIFQQLLHPVLLYYLIMNYYKSFGKYLLLFFQYCQILSKAVHKKEKIGERPDYFPKRMPEAMAVLASHQFSKLERFNLHRQKIAKLYIQSFKNETKNIKSKKSKTEEKLAIFLKGSNFELPVESPQIFLRFALKHPKAHIIVKKARKENILLGDWYDSVIVPKDTDLKKMKYEKGSCPVAESLTKETFNLPTHINITEKEVKIIFDFLEKEKYLIR